MNFATRLARRLPFFYGWLVIGIAFMSMALAVNARTSFSLVFPPILDEFGWDRADTAGAFSFGFLVSAAMSPFLGRAMERAAAYVEAGADVLFVEAPPTVESWVRTMLFATSTISVSPALVRSGTVTHVYWNADHVVSCNVSAPNGDHWSAQTPDGAGGTLTSPVGGNESSPITGQTIYTIHCATRAGRTLSGQAIVNVIPKYKED